MLNKAANGVAEFLSSAIEFMELSTIKKNGFENVKHSTPIFYRPALIETPNISQILSDHQRKMYVVIERSCRIHIDWFQVEKVPNIKN